jgi:hypothetical protein
MDIVFNTSNTFFGKNEMSLRDLLQALRETYCGTIGAEYMFIADQKIKKWWQEKLESIRSKPAFNVDKKRQILDRVTAAEGLERYLQAKYVGQKRFSLEGGESFIACMDEVIHEAGAKGVQEIVIGMAHRGRLNVLVNTLGKMPKDLFAEFEHKGPETLPAGDVKYHQGFSSDISTATGPVHVSLAFNPSHLEIVNPVVEGSARARMDRRGDVLGEQVLPVLVHGDAAIAGQGVTPSRAHGVIVIPLWGESAQVVVVHERIAILRPARAAEARFIPLHTVVLEGMQLSCAQALRNHFLYGHIDCTCRRWCYIRQGTQDDLPPFLRQQCDRVYAALHPTSQRSVLHNVINNFRAE